MLNIIFTETSTVTPITVSCSPTSLAEDTGTTSGSFTDTLTASVLNAVGAVSYLWTVGSEGGDGGISVVSPVTAATTVSYLGLTYNGAEASAILTCTATDSLGSSAFVNVAVVMTRTSGGGAPP